MQQQTYSSYIQQQQNSLNEVQRYQQQMASCSDVLVTDAFIVDKQFTQPQQG